MVHRQRAAGIVPSLEVAEGFEGTQDDMLALRPARSRFGYNNATRVTPVCWGNLIVTIPASRSRVTSNECARGRAGMASARVRVSEYQSRLVWSFGHSRSPFSHGLAAGSTTS